MNKQAPKENFTDLAADLALCIADCLEHPDCPEDLRDALNDPISNELLNVLLPPKNSILLRAVAGLAQSGDGGRPETESTSTSRFCAKNSAQNQERHALTKAN